jgi:maltose alpha-D-glucosyltransferase / alpha-amylase
VPGGDHRILLVDVQYVEESTETYVLPVTMLEGAAAQQLLDEHPAAVIAEVQPDEGPAAIIADAGYVPTFRASLLDAIHGRRRFKGMRGELHGAASGRLRRAVGEMEERHGRLLGAEQSNTSLVYGRDVVVKLYRRLEEGTSLDVELGEFLGEQGFANTPAVLGSLDYRHEPGATSRTLAVAQEFVTNEGDAWELTLDAVGEFYERAAATAEAPAPTDASVRALLRMAADGPSQHARTLVGPYLEEARLLGERTGEMHTVLASDRSNASFAPEEFTLFYQRSLYQSLRNLSGRVLQQLAGAQDTMSGSAQGAAQEVLGLDTAILRRFRWVTEGKVSGYRIRCHGDFHLGQVLYTGNDFFITDFEGEPIRPLSERRLKRSPLRDVAGMLRSYHYAAHAALFDHEARSHVRQSERTAMEWWARCWYAFVSAAFLNGYLTIMAPAGVLPSAADELANLLDIYVLEKAIYELGYELGNRPDWAIIPLNGILQLLEGEEPGA